MDNSDEVFCVFKPCTTGYLPCRNQQCITKQQKCDQKIDCFDSSDEECIHSGKSLDIYDESQLIKVDINGTGQFTVSVLSDRANCPATHFLCPEWFCIPVFFLCNGVDDCPGREDEMACDNYLCPGFYRCFDSTVCLHPDHVCDGVFHCPLFDDEMFCELSCPDTCRCQGLAFVCTANFPAASHPDLRYLNVSGSNMKLHDFINNTYLIRLHLQNCNIKKLPSVVLSNLIHLDLSHNKIENVSMKNFVNFRNLKILELANNPLNEIHSETSKLKIVSLHTLDLSNTHFEIYDGNALAVCLNLRTLNLSWSRLTTITKPGFQSTPLLEILDLRGTSVKEFPTNLLRNFSSLRMVYADNYRFCCRNVLPIDFNPENCHAKQDLFASCEDLLKSDKYRIALWVFALLSIIGNIGSLLVRLFLDGSTSASFSVFVSNLCFSDLCMGLYLGIIGTADIFYRGKYFWYEDKWKKSVLCKIAGLLSLLSSEVSTFFICLITVDRFIVLRFPFSTARFQQRSAVIASGIAWMIGVILASIPLLPLTSHWEFYSQTGICIPLPFTDSDSFLGYHYSVSIMIILNFILFLFIAIGQGLIYWSIKGNSMPSTNRKSEDAAIARRLITVVLSDFLCWFPVGVVGLLALTGKHIPGEVNVATAIFVLPFNSALNPFLYTLNVMMEKRLKAREALLLKRMETRMLSLSKINVNVTENV